MDSERTKERIEEHASTAVRLHRFFTKEGRNDSTAVRRLFAFTPPLSLYL